MMLVFSIGKNYHTKIICERKPAKKDDKGSYPWSPIPLSLISHIATHISLAHQFLGKDLRESNFRYIDSSLN